MLRKLGITLGCVWASPVTFFGAIYALFCWTLGWYQWYGLRDCALVWTIDLDRAPRWFLKLWSGWAGHTVGNVVVLKTDPSMNKGLILTHEQKHVDQCMRLGIFQPIMYGLSMAVIKLGCSGSDPYYDNPFEIDARRHAGQLIDVVGVANKLNQKTGSKT